MRLVVTLAGTFADDFHDEDLDSLREALEEEARYSGGSGVTVEVEKSNG